MYWDRELWLLDEDRKLRLDQEEVVMRANLFNAAAGDEFKQSGKILTENKEQKETESCSSWSQYTRFKKH